MALAQRPAPKVLVIDAANIPSDEPLLEKLRGLGAEVASRHMPGHKFLISIPHHSAVPQAIIDAIVAWFGETFPASAAAVPPRTRATATPPRAATRKSRSWSAAV